MGEEVEQQEFSREDRTRYREKVRRCLDVFARMLRESRFDADYPMTGLEIELNLVEENVRYFPALLPILETEDPLEQLEVAKTPSLAELRLHNGTIYRWNRPVYDVVGDRPHLRVENRLLPAGPSVVDICANAAFYYGLVRALVAEERPLWSRMSFSAAEENFHAAARDGIEAQVYWPGGGEGPGSELVLRRL